MKKISKCLIYQQKHKRYLVIRKDRKIEVTQRGIVQEGYSEDDLPWDMVNYKRVFKPNVDIEKFM